MAKKKKEKNGGGIFTAELAGMLLALISALSLLCLITGDSVFEKPGVFVQQFFLGAAGYFSFLALAFLLWWGIKLIAGIKTKGTAFRKVLLTLACYFFIALLIWHTAATVNLLGSGYTEYLNACYNGGSSLSQTTPGGWLFGAICYFPAALITPVGAYVVYGLLTCLVTALIFKNKIAGAAEYFGEKNKARRDRKEEKQKDEAKNRKNAEAYTRDTYVKSDDRGKQNGDEYNDFPRGDNRDLRGGSFKDGRFYENEQGGGNSDGSTSVESARAHKKNALDTIYANERFGLKTKREMKKNADRERSLKILFGSDDGAAYSSSHDFYDDEQKPEKDPFSPEYAPSYGGSYQDDYDRDMAAKTDYVHRPAAFDYRSSVSSPMGSDMPDSVTGRNEYGRGDDSMPARDTYVISDGKSRESVSAFDRRRYDRYERMRAGEENGNERSEPFTYSESYGSDGSFNDYSSSSSRRNQAFGSRDYSSRGFENGGRADDDFVSRRIDFSSQNDNDNYRDGGFSQGVANARSERDDRSDGNVNVFGERVSSYGARGNDFAKDDYSDENEDFNSRIRLNEEAEGFAPAKRFERASDKKDENGVEVEELFSVRRDNSLDDEPKSPGIEALKKVSVVKDDRAGQTTNTTTEKRPPFVAAADISGDGLNSRQENRDYSAGNAAYAVSSSAAPVSAMGATPSASVPAGTTDSRPTRGSQLKLADVPEGNRLENPIDNMPANYRYNFAPYKLMNDYRPDAAAIAATKREQESRKETILGVLKNANIDAQIVDVKYGPALTRFELTIPTSTSIKKVLEKQDDLNLWLAAKGKIRIVAPITGTTRIGIEVPNSSPQTVGLKELVMADGFKNAKKSSLTFCLGKDLVGNPVNLDLTKMPHLLVAGATGTGKSVFLNTLLISLMYKYTPQELRIILVDPKIVEFSLFKGTPNLLFDEIITETRKACAMLDWACKEMDDRYLKLHDVLVKNVDEYNAYVAERGGKPMYKILIIIDEFADLMATATDKKNIENKIGRIAAKARAAGIHLIMATQRPSVDIMEGSIKTNFTSRIAFKMSSPTDAQVIMGEIGAEKLLGRGDVLYRTSTMMGTERAQGAFIDTPEIDRICKYLSEHNKCYYNEEALDEITKNCEKEDATAANATDVLGGESGSSTPVKNDEEIIKRAMRLAISINNISTSMMQRRLGLGYPKAAKIMDTLVDRKYVGPSLDSRTREIKMTKEEFEQTFGEPFDITGQG